MGVVTIEADERRRMNNENTRRAEGAGVTETVGELTFTTEA